MPDRAGLRPGKTCRGDNLSEWRKYRVGNLSTHTNWTKDCQPFHMVGHTSHVDSAMGIVRNGSIKPVRVYDKSKLNNSRILVVWLSPNTWGDGYRYGGVKFDFDFRTLVEGMNFYWVETIRYEIPACRILITDQDRSDKLAEYDPTIGDGPWWFDEESYTDYYNGKCCLEFMFEREIPLSDVDNVRFVDHHKKFCSVPRDNQGPCKEKGMDAGRLGAMFLSKACASNTSLAEIHDKFLDAGLYSGGMAAAIRCMLEKILIHNNFSGPLKETSKLAVPVGRATMNAYIVGRQDEAMKLAGKFRSLEAFMKTTAIILADCLDIEDYREIYRKMI